MKRELTPMELAVLNGAAWGETAQMTGKRLGYAGETVRTARKRAAVKLGARNMAHAVYIYFVQEDRTHVA